MIYYLFNSFYPDKSGFAIRCYNELSSIVDHEKVTIICRKRNKESLESTVKIKDIEVKIFRFKDLYNKVELPKYFYKLPRFFEIIRSAYLFLSIGYLLLKIFIKDITEKKKLFVVNSPVTLPLISIIISKFFNASLLCVDYHDLEPEMALHIKKIDKLHFIYKLEIILEKIVTHSFDKVIVTNTIQKEILCLRNKLIASKIYILPNVGNNNLYIANNREKKLIRNDLGFTSNDLVIGYISSLTFKFTYTGFIKLLKITIKSKIKNIRYLVIGDGDGKEEILEYVRKSKLNSTVKLFSSVENLSGTLAAIDIAIIPWERNEFTNTILPTKLAEYLSVGKIIIAPNFGCFNNIIKDNCNGYLYDDFKQIPEIIEYIFKDKTNKKISKNAIKTYEERYKLPTSKNDLFEFLKLGKNEN